VESDNELRHAGPDAGVAGFLSERAAKQKQVRKLSFPHSGVWTDRSGLLANGRRGEAALRILRRSAQSDRRNRTAPRGSSDEADCKRSDSDGRTVLNMNLRRRISEARRGESGSGALVSEEKPVNYFDFATCARARREPRADRPEIRVKRGARTALIHGPQARRGKSVR